MHASIKKLTVPALLSGFVLLGVGRQSAAVDGIVVVNKTAEFKLNYRPSTRIVAAGPISMSTNQSTLIDTKGANEVTLYVQRSGVLKAIGMVRVDLVQRRDPRAQIVIAPDRKLQRGLRILSKGGLYDLTAFVGTRVENLSGRTIKLILCRVAPNAKPQTYQLRNVQHRTIVLDGTYDFIVGSSAKRVNVRRVRQIDPTAKIIICKKFKIGQPKIFEPQLKIASRGRLFSVEGFFQR